MSIGDFPESLTQAILVGIMLVGRLRAPGSQACGQRRWKTTELANYCANHNTNDNDNNDDNDNDDSNAIISIDNNGSNNRNCNATSVVTGANRTKRGSLNDRGWN